MAVEYIKREDALNAIRKSPISNMGTRLFCIDAIADIPAADVVQRELYQRALSDVVTLSVERKRGEWIAVDPAYGYYKCSECRKGTTFDMKPYNFCPNCGTDMRESEVD